MFFQLEDICRQHCDEDIRHALNNLPKDLAETLRRALRRIETQKHGTAARKVFSWVAASKRPMLLPELREAIAIKIGQQHSDPTKLYNDMDNIASWCENLVHVEEESQAVQFVHSAVRVFLVEQLAAHDLTKFQINLDDTEHRLGELCVTYLGFNDFKTTLAVREKPLVIQPSRVIRAVAKPGSKRAALLSQMIRPGSHNMSSSPILQRPAAMTHGDAHPFLDYASENWIFHTRTFRKSASRTWPIWFIMVTGAYETARVPWSGTYPDVSVWAWTFSNRHYSMIYLLTINSEIPGARPLVRNEIQRAQWSEDDLKNVIREADRLGDWELKEMLRDVQDHPLVLYRMDLRVMMSARDDCKSTRSG